MDRFVVRKGDTEDTAVPDLVHHLQAVVAQKGTCKRLTGTSKPWKNWDDQRACGICVLRRKNKMLTKQTHVVKFNRSPIQTFAELLLAALLPCASFGDRNPRIPFLPMHLRFWRCGISPRYFGIGTPPEPPPPPYALIPDKQSLAPRVAAAHCCAQATPLSKLQ